MNAFNSNNFIKTLKESYGTIPVPQGNQAAKVMVAGSIKSNGYNPEDVLTFICGQMGNPSIKFSNEDWKGIIKMAIKRGGLIGKCLEVCVNVKKGKVSYENLFFSVVSHCGENPEMLMKELFLNQVGWKKVADTLVKIEPVMEETKTVKKVVVKRGRKSSTKTANKDPRCMSITLIKDGVKREWASYRDCEKEIGAGHGTISQLFSGKLKSAKGWVLWREEEEKAPLPTMTKTIRQYGCDKMGHKVDRVWSSLSEAAKGTGIPLSSISKAISGTYQSAGGYKWEKTAVAA